MILSVKPFEIHDGDGIRTTVFFKGCPLRCKWCHNPESFFAGPDLMYDASLCRSCMRCVGLCDANREQNGSHLFDRSACLLCQKCANVCRVGALEPMGREVDAETLVEELMRDEIFWRGSGGGVTLSGGEPLMQPALCAEVARLLTARGVHVALDTSGYASRGVLDRVLPYVNAVLFDLKAINDEVHLRCTGVSNRQILENLRYLDARGVPMEIRYPYVPEWNAVEAEEVAKFVATLKTKPLLRLLPYHSFATRKYECLGMQYLPGDLPMPSKEEVSDVLARMRRYTEVAIFD